MIDFVFGLSFGCLCIYVGYRIGHYKFATPALNAIKLAHELEKQYEEAFNRSIQMFKKYSEAIEDLEEAKKYYYHIEHE